MNMNVCRILCGLRDVLLFYILWMNDFELRQFLSLKVESAPKQRPEIKDLLHERRRLKSNITNKEILLSWDFCSRSGLIFVWMLQVLIWQIFLWILQNSSSFSHLLIRSPHCLLSFSSPLDTLYPPHRIHSSSSSCSPTSLLFSAFSFSSLLFLPIFLTPLDSPPLFYFLSFYSSPSLAVTFLLLVLTFPEQGRIWASHMVWFVHVLLVSVSHKSVTFEFFKIKWVFSFVILPQQISCWRTSLWSTNTNDI